MYTALIAEDELLVRMGIASSVPWEEYNIRLIGVAENGEQALEMYQEHHPDIVITDVRMPKFSGLDLIQYIRSESLSCTIIIVTNVDDDDTIGIARRFGVADILFKASMKQNDIMSAVKRACDNLVDKENGHNPVLTERDLWKKFFKDPENAPEILYRIFGIASFCIHPAENLSRRWSSQFEEELRKCFESVQCAIVSSFNKVYLICKTSISEIDGKKLIQTAIRNFRSNQSVHISAMCVFAPLEAIQLKGLIKKMQKMDSNTHFFDDAILVLSSGGVFQHRRLSALKRELEQYALPGRNIRGLQNCLAALAEYPGDLSDGDAEIRRRGQNLLDLIGDTGNYSRFSDQIEAVCAALTNYCEKLKKKIRPEILKVVHYLDENLSSKLAAAEVAKALGFNVSYFSRMFKKEMGCTYSEYLAELRMQRAKALLEDTQKSIQTISEECGFSEVSYFSYRFKILTGITPMQWRNQ